MYFDVPQSKSPCSKEWPTVTSFNPILGYLNKLAIKKACKYQCFHDYEDDI